MFRSRRSTVQIREAINRKTRGRTWAHRTIGRQGGTQRRKLRQPHANHRGKSEIAKSVLRVGSPLTTSRTPRRRPSSARQDLRDLRRQGSAVRRAEGLRPHAGALGERSARRGDLLHQIGVARGVSSDDQQNPSTPSLLGAPGPARSPPTGQRRPACGRPPAPRRRARRTRRASRGSAPSPRDRSGSGKDACGAAGSDV